MDAEAFTAAGVTLAGDVAVFERAKLRLLNGAHSTLAYLGLALGYETVAEAMADARLAAFIEALMRDDIAPTLAPATDLDLPAYIGEVLARFRNRAIVHKLSQIAWDGSQKLPFRLLGTIQDALDANRPVDRLSAGVAAWMAFVRRQSLAARPIVDPLAEQLAAIGRACDGIAEHDVPRFLAISSVFPPRLASDPRFTDALTAHYRALAAPRPTLRGGRTTAASS